jgi:Tol biopolymer transport system component
MDTPDYFAELGPSWSPDDSRIVFYEFFWTGKIYVVDVDGSNLEELASEKGYQNGRVGPPNWRRNS